MLRVTELKQPGVFIIYPKTPEIFGGKSDGLADWMKFQGYLQRYPSFPGHNGM